MRMLHTTTMLLHDTCLKISGNGYCSSTVAVSSARVLKRAISSKISVRVVEFAVLAFCTKIRSNVPAAAALVQWQFFNSSVLVEPAFSAVEAALRFLTYPPWPFLPNE